MQTIGLSPKAIAAGITGYAAPLVIGWLAEKWGLNVDASTAQAFLLPLVTAAVTFAAAYLAKAGLVHADLGPDPEELDLANPPAKAAQKPKPRKSTSKKKAA